MKTIKTLNFIVTENRIKLQKPANNIIQPINIYVYDTKMLAYFYPSLAVTRNNLLDSR